MTISEISHRTTSLPAIEENIHRSTPDDNIAISVDSVSKMYPLYAQPSDRLKQSLWYALPRFLRGQPRQFFREFWALRDVSEKVSIFTIVTDLLFIFYLNPFTFIVNHFRRVILWGQMPDWGEFLGLRWGYLSCVYWAISGL